MRKCYVLLLLFACLFDAFAQVPITVRFKPDATVGQDALISTSYGCISQGNTKPLELMNDCNHSEIVLADWTYNSQGCSRATTRSLLKFDELATIPASATIISAELKLYGVSSGNNAIAIGNSSYPGSPFNNQSYPSGSYYNTTNPSAIYEVTSSWNEQTVTWNTQPSFNSNPIINIPISTVQWNRNFTDKSAKLLQIVQKWVQNPSRNFGFMIKLDVEDYYRSVLFASSNHSDPALHPELIVTYRMPCVPDTTRFTATICEGETYSENGFSKSKSGTYYDTLKNVGGCDSLIVLNLEVEKKDLVPIFDTICEGGTYTQYGFNTSVSGTYYDTLQNIKGCDSVIVLNLKVINKDTTFISDTICEGNTYSKFGFNASDTGIYMQNLLNRFNCDSTVILHLSVIPQLDTVFISDSICEGETYKKYGFNASTTDIYVKNLQNRFNCDSIVVLDLKVNPKPYVEISATTENFCEKDFIELEITTNGTAFSWNTGSTDNPIIIYKPGVYLVTVFWGDCEEKASYTLEECPCLAYIPNTFTPNGDGVNDVFQPSLSCYETLKSYRLSIYDRWGNLIFWSLDYAIGWDGTTYKGGACAEGVYNAVIAYTTSKDEHVVKNIAITLLR